MKKVLILANYSLGLYNFRFELVDELINQGYEVYVSLPEHTNDRYVQLLIKAGAKHIQTPINRRGINPIEDLKLVKGYKKIIKEVNPDIILTYTIKPNIYGTFAAATLKKPVIMNITGIGSSFTSPKLKYIVMPLYKYACKRANTVFFQNKNNYSLFIENKLIDPLKSKIIPGSGVNTKKFFPINKEKTDKITRFLFIGRLMREKGIKEYIEAAESLTLHNPNIEFRILGLNEDEKYKQYILENKNNQIIYLGTSNDVRNEIKEVDCIVHPSYHEGMSNVLLEGAAMGKPLLASNISGCREILIDGKSGYLFEPKSVTSLLNKLYLFLSLNQHEKDLMGKNSREKVKKEFDRRIIVDEYINTINIIVDKGKAKNELIS